MDVFTAIDEFKAKYEILAGHVHIVPDAERATEAIGEIITTAGASCAAMTRLSPSLQSAVENWGAANTLELLRPPYSASDLPGAIDRAQVGISAPDFAIAET